MTPGSELPWPGLQTGTPCPREAWEVGLGALRRTRAISSSESFPPSGRPTVWGDNPGLTLYIGNAAELKQKDIGSVEIMLSFLLGQGRALYRLFNSFVKE